MPRLGSKSQNSQYFPVEQGICPRWDVETDVVVAGFGAAGFAASVTAHELGLSRWIFAERPTELYVRHVQRNARLPGLRTAEQIKRAADALVEADWLHPPAAGSLFGQRRRSAHCINSRPVPGAG